MGATARDRFFGRAWSFLPLLIVGCGDAVAAGSDAHDAEPEHHAGSDPDDGRSDTAGGERLCDDGIDDDGDGLTDCEDLDDCDVQACDASGDRICRSGRCVCRSGPLEAACADGEDNDCDGLADEGLDYDLDGYPGCNGEDCDDYNANVNPGAPEVPYDGVDNDCDGTDVTDVDGDGYDGGAYGQDCDDQNPAVSPAAAEVCGDGADGDCDGLTDEYDEDCGGVGDDDSAAGDDDDCACDAGSAPAAPWLPALLAVAAGVRLRRRR